ncbi:hypothetical protein O181_024583 [Austropuccinia psidii MF-1]|uniref:Uncharacterized protein n=1 Tax=Austropuccinia psidii MF-1 TaxID=1389203 RepID=A0A9Q3GYC3_9BASI|nr:hypothetical protein [Austropuccinia psidii MF-1]
MEAENSLTTQPAQSLLVKLENFPIYCTSVDVEEFVDSISIETSTPSNPNEIEIEISLPKPKSIHHFRRCNDPDVSANVYAILVYDWPIDQSDHSASDEFFTKLLSSLHRLNISSLTASRQLPTYSKFPPLKPVKPKLICPTMIETELNGNPIIENQMTKTLSSFENKELPTLFESLLIKPYQSAGTRNNSGNASFKRKPSKKKNRKNSRQ